MKTKIIGSRLRELRERHSLTQVALGERAKVSKQHVYKIEAGLVPSVRSGTAQKLADALGVPLSRLTSEPESRSRSDTAVPPSTTAKVTIELHPAALNAARLAADRYRVREEQVFELAPFLFAWAADRSLREREARLNRLMAAQEQVEEMAPKFPHLASWIVFNSRAQDVVAAEQTSINKRDIFGSTIEAEDDELGSAALYDGQTNPFEAFLQEGAAEAYDAMEFESFARFGSPSYVICRDRVSALMAGNEVAIRAVLNGAARLAEMPAGKTPGERAQWAVEQAAIAEATFRDENPELAALLDSLESSS